MNSTHGLPLNPLQKALLVLTKTPHIRDYLEKTDPKALEQAEKALTALTVELTPEVLRALSCGLRDLEKGDPNDLKVADSVTDQIFRQADLVPDHMGWVRRSEVVNGYVQLPGKSAVYAFINASGEWVCPDGRLPKGTPVYLQPECQDLLRETT